MDFLRGGQQPSPAETVQPIAWGADFPGRLYRFGGLGGGAGVVLALIGVGRGVFVLIVQVLFRLPIHLPPFRDAVVFLAEYVGAFAMGGTIVGLLWPLRVRPWGRVVVSYVGAGVIMLGITLMARTVVADQPAAPWGFWVFVWALMTAIFGSVPLAKD